MSGDVTVGLESERKYDVPDPVAVPPLASLAHAVRSSRFTLRATYFDTADDALARHRMTLRRREGGHDEGWHLKTPGNGGRLEHWSALADELPAELRAAAGDLLAGQVVTEIADLVTDRTASTLLDPDGTAFAEMADDRVTATDRRSGTVRSWREWEIELEDGAPADADAREALLDRLESSLLAAGAVPSTAVSKLARAMGRAPLPS